MARRKSHPLFSPIKKQIETTRDKLRKQHGAASSKAVKANIHKLFQKLHDTFKELGFGKLDNIKPGGKKPKKPRSSK